jgi:hypothetical protein
MLPLPGTCGTGVPEPIITLAIGPIIDELRILSDIFRFSGKLLFYVARLVLVQHVLP